MARIPESAKRFLVEVGLPSCMPRNTTFRTPAPPDPVPRHPSIDHCRVIGYMGPYHDNPICLDEMRDGAAVMPGRLPGDPAWFMNTSVEKLAECLVGERQFHLESEAYRLPPGEPWIPEAQLQSWARDLERRLREIDPVAFEVERAFWRHYLMRVEDEHW